MIKFWNWRPLISASGEQTGRVLELNGVIAEESWWGDEVTPEAFKQELMGGTGDIEVYINSPGGDCIAASRIYTMLVEYPGMVTVKIDGMAASAASVVAMAGSTVLMAPTAMMMIHDPSTGAWGNRAEFEKTIEVLDEYKESIMNAYEKKTGLSRAKLSHMMEDETWMNAKKAIELGFADDMIGDNQSSTAQAYAYSAVSAARKFTNMLHAEANKSKTGARVSSLMAALYEMK